MDRSEIVIETNDASEDLDEIDDAVERSKAQEAQIKYLSKFYEVHLSSDPLVRSEIGSHVDSEERSSFVQLLEK